MKTAPVERMIARRYLRPRKRDGFLNLIAFLALAGTALGVGALIVVMAVMNGFRYELLGRVLGIDGHAEIRALTGMLDKADALAERVRTVPEVVSAVPILTGQAMATDRAGRAIGVLVRAVAPKDLASQTLVADSLTTTEVRGFSQTDGVLIGYRLAARLGLRQGDKITLIAPKGQATAFGTIPRVKSFPIAGSFRVDMSEYDSRIVIMPLAAAQYYFQKGSQISAVEIRTRDPQNITKLFDSIMDAAGHGYQISAWQTRHGSLFTAIQVERNVMFLILTLIILVAAFNIVSTLVMLVKAKARDIAVLRTMGAPRSMIMKIFFRTGAILGFIGTGSGFLLGITFASNIERLRQLMQSLTGVPLFDPTIYFLAQLPARVDPWDVIAVVGMGLGLSLLATLYPSWQAARVDPIETLRYE